MSEVKVPELAESISEGTISEWLKSVGDQVEQGENIVELETDKVNVEVISEVSGVLSEIKAEEGDTVEVGSVIAIVSEGESGSTSSEQKESDDSESKDSKDKEKQTEAPKESAAKSEDTKQTEDTSKEEASSNDRVQATPSARKLAREKGIDLNKVKTQAGDVVRPEDVEKASQPSKPAAQKNENPSKPVVREKLSRRRQTIAKKLLEVSNNTAMLTTFNEVDMTNVMELRKRKKDKFQEDHNGTRLGFMSFFTKASVAALKKYPDVNAEIDGTDLLLKQYYDIGIAVSTEEGLVVPNVRDCDKKNFAEIEQDIHDLAVKANNKKLGLDDMMGGSFTITNGGVFGSLMSTPIINGTQAAILGMHSIVTRPIAIDKERMENRPMMYIALSYDHRIIDGKQAVGFLKTIKDLIENPEDLLLES